MTFTDSCSKTLQWPTTRRMYPGGENTQKLQQLPSDYMKSDHYCLWPCSLQNKKRGKVEKANLQEL